MSKLYEKFKRETGSAYQSLIEWAAIEEYIIWLEKRVIDNEAKFTAQNNGLPKTQKETTHDNVQTQTR